MNSSQIESDGSFTTVVALDTGTTELAALQAFVAYDEDKVSVSSCQISAVGACSDNGGEVAFAGLGLDGLADAENFVSIEFVAEDVSQDIDLDLVIETAVDKALSEIEDLELVAEEILAQDFGSLSGLVVDVFDLGLAGIEVCAADADGNQTCVTSSGLGYFFEDLPAGDYTITMTDPNEILGTVTLEATVVADQVTTGVSASLARADEDDTAPAPAEAGTITGTVTSDGEPVFGIKVCATMVVVGTQDCGYAKADGSFSLEGLPIGNYNISTHDRSGLYGSADVPVVGVNPGVGVSGLEIELG